MPPQQSCCAVIEESAAKSRARAEARTEPQPWLVIKLMVPITFGIMVYTAYVYIGRLCVPAIHGHYQSLSRGGGIALLTVFCPLYLWMLWAYYMTCITPPGFARDHVSKTSQPEPYLPTNGELGAGLLSNPARSSIARRDSIGGPSYEDLAVQSALQSSNPDNRPPEAPYDVRSGLPLPATALSDKDRIDDLRVKMAMMNVTRRPPITPVLLPEYRYCSKDEIIKPYRAHHCRICGTCVLKFDHHCPWIGQCVGARNHKFFINFNQATAMFTAYVFATLLAYTVKESDSDIDAQRIVIIALAALFCLFTSSLFASHVRLLCLSETTVESMRDQSMKEKEDHLISGALGFCNFPAKIRLKQAWNKEWGRIGKEGNIWWMGSARAGWEDTMGTSWIGWILPVGRGLSDGLNYTPNPRFDSEGRWRRRKEWPVELR
ncbi:zf-DHHC-domain-containing protein [Cylindrobasidium torrendii FP15055 ss-10]|uniref:Palmitoyltransferase n=1 Tax=Cylindrobasidium torrendii FP15055 ss-10 TaxID=1314674 RepID=A0A0D7BGP3_9AGAR|nr:zf-DHHC-domain-containing protein [Cylindrobasidium torrendii FP15055 ss-10]